MAALFKSAVTGDAGTKAAQAARTPLGALRARTDRAQTFLRTLPGVPDGQYVVLQYDTQFSNKAGAVETVTVMLEGEADWKVIGYFIK